MHVFQRKYDAIMLAFQANDAGSIPAARSSNIIFRQFSDKYYRQMVIVLCI